MSRTVFQTETFKVGNDSFSCRSSGFLALGFGSSFPLVSFSSPQLVSGRDTVDGVGFFFVFAHHRNTAGDENDN